MAYTADGEYVPAPREADVVVDISTHERLVAHDGATWKITTHDPATWELITKTNMISHGVDPNQIHVRITALSEPTRTPVVRRNRGLSFAAVVLPAAARARYAEEWLGELYDLRAEGARWWRRAGYVVGVVFNAAPHLAASLRWARRRAVD